MTATNDPQTPGAVPFWQHFKPGAWVWPLALALVFAAYLGINKLVHQPDTKAVAETSGQAAYNGAAQALAAATTAPPAEAPAPTTPGYDYLECTHQLPTDPTPCTPVLIWPLTDGAKRFIGYQNGGIDGELNTANTRSVFEQIRDKYQTVDVRSLWLSYDRDKAGNTILTVWPSEAKAPAGSVALVNASPTKQTTSGTIPTEGVS